jgi:GNAT superfamily N-acetyltransferase
MLDKIRSFNSLVNLMVLCENSENRFPPIKLGAISPRFRNAAEDIREQIGEPVGFDEYDKRVITSYDVMLDIGNFGNFVTLNSIIVPDEKRGKGLATKAMKEFIHLADEQDVPVRLTAKPLELFGERLSKSQLISWYSKFGFELQRDDETMIRQPKSIQP